MNKVYNALDIAHYIIKYEGLQGRTVSNLRLQKLLYFVQCTFLATSGAPCFSEDMEAWDYGPVVPEVYRKYKIFGSTMISEFSDDQNVKIVPADQKLIEMILDACGNRTTRQLVDISHHQDPWKNAYVPGISNIISKDAMLDYVRKS